MPYDPTHSITDQVHASIRSSLRNLRLREENDDEEQTYIDTVLLHSPLPTMAQTLEAWSALESYVPHRVRNMGISNCTLAVLEELYRSPQVRTKPVVVQNRFYPTTRFDGALRAFCREHGIVYQSFWTLTANPQLLRSAEVAKLAQEAGISAAAALYCLVLGLGQTTVLDGTTNASRMAEDLAAPKRVEQYANEQPDAWQELLASFKTLIRQPVSDR